MKRFRVVGLVVVAMFALTALVGTAVASAPKNLTLKTAKGALAANAQVTGSSSNLIFKTSAGNLECSKNVIEGTVGNNGGKKDSGSITKESSTGEEAGGLCKTTTPLGIAKIESKNLPWSIVFTDKGVAEVKGKKVAFTSVFPNGGNATCTFETSKVKSSFAIGGPVKITVAKQKFKINKKISTSVCPKEGTLEGEFSVTSNSETVESELT